MTYYLNSLHIDCGTGIAKASINVSFVDDLTGTSGGFDRAVVNPSPQVQAKIDAICQDAMTYIRNKHPGVTLTLPPLRVDE